MLESSFASRRVEADDIVETLGDHQRVGRRGGMRRQRRAPTVAVKATVLVIAIPEEWLFYCFMPRYVRPLAIRRKVKIRISLC